jgi:hypothetical protein
LYPNKLVKKVSPGDVRPGDIVWKPGHVQLVYSVKNGVEDKVCEAENPQVKFL